MSQALLEPPLVEPPEAEPPLMLHLRPAELPGFVLDLREIWKPNI